MYDRQRPTLTELIERLTIYSKIDYGAPAYELSRLEALLLVKELERESSSGSKSKAAYTVSEAGYYQIGAQTVYLEANDKVDFPTETTTKASGREFWVLENRCNMPTRVAHSEQEAWRIMEPNDDVIYVREVIDQDAEVAMSDAEINQSYNQAHGHYDLQTTPKSPTKIEVGGIEVEGIPEHNCDYPEVYTRSRYTGDKFEGSATWCRYCDWGYTTIPDGSKQETTPELRPKDSVYRLKKQNAELYIIADEWRKEVDRLKAKYEPVYMTTGTMDQDTPQDDVNLIAEGESPEPWETQKKLHSTSDAKTWAEEFVKIHGGDEGLMLGWFANAIMKGFDDAQNRSEERIAELEKELEERRVSTPTMNAVHMLSCQVQELTAENERLKADLKETEIESSELATDLYYIRMKCEKYAEDLKLATDALEYIAEYSTKPYGLSTDPDQSQKARETLAKLKPTTNKGE